MLLTQLYKLSAMNTHIVKPQFYLFAKRKSRLQNQVWLYMRIMYQSGRVDKSLGIKINYDNWDHQNNRTINNSFLQKQVEEVFSEHKEKIMGNFYQLTQNSIEFTLKELVTTALGSKKQKSISVLNIFNDEILRMEMQLKESRQKSNILKHATCRKYLASFIKSRLQVNDINFNRINRKFIDDFHHYLLHDCNNAHNSAMKLLQIFKKIYTIALNNRWVNYNAFAGKKISYIDPDIQSLTEDELNAIKSLTDLKPYLEKTKQLFLFSVYTGMAYKDVQSLQRKHIEKKAGSDAFIIRKKREKTGVEFLLPLFAPALSILNNWINGWEQLSGDTFLAPRLSNQNFNIHLKELSAHAGIQKNITTHSGRHTFATTIALENGVPLETVSKMVGHSKLSQTQKYAKVTYLKVERETKMLSEKLAIMIR